MKMTISNGKTCLKPDGDLTVARAVDFKDALVNAITTADSIEVDMEDVTRIDLACLQLLCSAHRTATAAGKSLAVSEPSAPVYLKARQNAGFLMHNKQCSHVPTDDCLWAGGDA